ncbi:MAG TPA: poly-gamma-glutamate hydrolase family protein [Acidimicrobiales bacterium]|nr:poly-gamma-glutamate hydrolase family protein [Acidimicrobiales bacterium]
MSFAELLAHPGVEEVCELRGRFGFMAFHGGSLEEMTDVIARAAAARAGASYYGVHQPPDLQWHIPSTQIDPAVSTVLGRFLQHVDVVVTVHGYGREGLWSALLVGGGNRTLGAHLGGHLRQSLPAYDVIDDIDRVPRELRGLHRDNPVNRPRHGGAQLELPPRVRGTSPLWWDWEGPGLTPHTASLVDALVATATTWNGTPHGDKRSINQRSATRR